MQDGVVYWGVDMHVGRVCTAQAREGSSTTRSPRVRDVVSVEAAHEVDVLGHAHDVPDLQLCIVVSFQG